MSNDKKAAAMPTIAKLTKAQQSGQALIRDWQEAYRAAWDKEPPLVTFERGRFRFHTGYCPSYPRAHVEGMLSRLRSRAASAVKPGPLPDAKGLAAARSPQATAEPST